ncbi:hypothetical protein F5B21DRAFT_484099 [Xylaria acuta]|nr:hypothetical protein F5B21DRAFT_484099 [Xylaria acuta]
MSHFDRLPDATLRRILTFVVARDTVFYIDEFSCRAQDDKEATNVECKVRATESMLVFHPTRDSENGIYICDRPVNAEFFGEFSGDETRVVTCPDRKDRRMYCKPNIVYPSQVSHQSLLPPFYQVRGVRKMRKWVYQVWSCYFWKLPKLKEFLLQADITDFSVLKEGPCYGLGPHPLDQSARPRYRQAGVFPRKIDCHGYYTTPSE